MSKIIKNFGGFWDEVDGRVKKYLLERIYRYERILEGLFRGPKSGKVYGAEQKVTFQSFSYDTLSYKSVSFTAHRGKALGAKGRKGKVHVASAPGEPPAILTGRLRQSIKHVIERLGPGRYRATVGSTVKDYPKHLEYGTSEMEARPAWRPALEQLRDEEHSK